MQHQVSFLHYTNVLKFSVLECSFRGGYWALLHIKLVAPFFVIIVMVLVKTLPHLISILKAFSESQNISIYQAKKDLLNNFLSPWMARCPVAILFLAYTVSIVVISQPFTCQLNLAGEYVLIASPNLNCFDQEWLNSMQFVWICVIIYVIIIPAALIYSFYSFRHDIPSSWFQKRFGMLTLHFRPKFFYWEIFVALIVNVLSRFVGSMTKYFLVICILFGFLLLEIQVMPYVSYAANQSNML